MLTICLILLLISTGIQWKDESASWKEQLAAAIESSQASRKKIQRMTSSWMSYATWCMREELQPLPATFAKIGGFVIDFVQKQSGRTSSVGNKLSQVKKAIEQMGQDWLKTKERLELKQLIANLAYDDYVRSNRKKPLTKNRIRSMISIRGSTSQLGLCIALLYALGHDGLLRGGELTSDLRLFDVEWDETADKEGRLRRILRIKLDRTKTHRAGEPIRVSYFETYYPYSAPVLMEAWLSSLPQDRSPSRIVFPQIRFLRGKPSSLDFSKSLTYAALAKLIRHDVNEIGLNPQDFGSHSLRAGGATDLFVSGILTLPQIMIVGRWKTVQAAMVYFRADLEAAELAGRVFGSC